ncbi:hypothetical protein WS62_12800 [Burkholderia sp. ABCPW 14]|nr:hypothetical protein WS62_12800 [Burkholderia sp. ABCPW 14]
MPGAIADRRGRLGICFMMFRSDIVEQRRRALCRRLDRWLLHRARHRSGRRRRGESASATPARARPDRSTRRARRMRAALRHAADENGFCHASA